MTAEKRPSFLKRILRLTVILLVLLALFVALAPTLFSGFIRDKIVANANERLDGRLEIAEFSFGWTSGLEMSGLKLVRRGQTAPALEVGEARAKPSILDAISGRYLVEDLELAGVTLRVRRGEAGVDWKDVMKPAPEAEKKDEALPEFRLAGTISELSVVYEDDALGAPVEFRDLAITFSAGRDQAATLKLSGPEGLAADVEATVIEAGKVLSADRMSARGSLALPRAELARFAAGLKELVTIRKGSLALNQTFTYRDGSLDLDGSIDLEGLDAVAKGMSCDLVAGRVTNDLTMRSDGMGGQFGLTLGRIRIAGLPRQKAPLELTETKLKITMPAAGSLKIDDGDLRMPAGTVAVSGQLDAASGKIDLGGDLDIAAIAGLFEGLPGLEGRIKLDGDLVRQGDSMRLTGEHVITGLTARDLAPGLPAIRNEKVSFGHAIGLADSAYDLDRVDLLSSFAELHVVGLRYQGGEGRIENAGGRENPISGWLDLDRIGALLGDLMPMTMKGRADLAARIGRTNGSESASLTLTSRNLELGGGPLGKEVLRPGPTSIGLDVADIARGAASPMTLTARSDIFDLTAQSALEAREGSAFGFVGNLKVAGDARLDRLLAPFFDSAHIGKTALDLDAGLGAERLDLRKLQVTDKALALEAKGAIERQGRRQKVDLSLPSGRYRTAAGAQVEFAGGAVQLGRGLDDDSIDLALTLAQLATKSSAPDARRIDAGAVALRGAGTLDAVNKAAVLTISELKAGGADLTGALDWSTEGGLKKLQLKGDVDWAALAQRFITLIDPAASGQGKGPLAVDLSSRDGTMKTASGEFDLQVPGLRLEGCDLSALKLAGSMTDGKGAISEGRANLNKGTVTLGGNIDLTQEEPQFGSDFEAKNVQLAKEWQPAIARVIPIFAGVGVEFSGVIDSKVDLTGQGSTWDAISKVLNGDGSLALRQGRVESSPLLDAVGLALGFSPDMAIDDLATAFQIKDGGVYQDGLAIKTGVIDLKLAGTTYLDGRLDYALGLKPVSKEPARWQQFVALVASDGYLPLRLGGTVSSPSPKMPDPTDLIRKGAEDAIKRGLGDILKPKGGEGDKKDGEAKPKNPIGGLIDILGGRKKDEPKKDEPKKDGQD